MEPNVEQGRSVSSRVIGLDYVRVFAALSVMLYHYGYYFGIAGGAFGTRVPLFPSLHFAWPGWIGVEIFFVVSGYVITFSAAASTPYRFARGRVMRIWPGVLVCGAISATLAFMLPHVAPFSVASSLLRTLVLSPKGPWIDGVYWTLVIEMVFYCVIYLALRLLGRGGLKWVAVGLTMWSSLYWCGTLFIGFLGHNAGDYACAVLLLRHGGLFAFGMYIYFLQQEPRDNTLSALAIVALFACAAEISYQANAAAAVAHSVHSTLPLLVWIACMFFMIVAAWTPIFKARTSSSANRVAQTAGRMTYPIYLMHGVIGSLLLPILPHRIAIGACVVIVLTLSALFISGPEQLLATEIGHGLDWLQGVYHRLRANRPSCSAS